MNGENTEVIVEVLSYAFALLEFGLEREAIVADVHAKVAGGASSKEISAYLRDLADSELAKANGVQEG